MPTPIYLSDSTLGAPFSLLPAGSSPTGPELFCAVQGGVSVGITYQQMQSSGLPPLTYVNTNHTVSGLESGYAVDGSTATVTITLHDLASWQGQEIAFINAGPSGTFSIAAAGSDVIVNPSSGATSSTMTSGNPGTSFALRKVLMPSPGVSGWYVTSHTIA